MTASHSRTMLVEGSERSFAFSTFKRRVVGGSVYPKLVDQQRRLSYNTKYSAGREATTPVS
jgi:hypothetical protein